MKPIAVLYAHRDSHTRRIAEHVAAELAALRFDAELIDVATLEGPIDLDCYAAAVLAAAVHVGNHEREVVRFVRDHRAQLERIPTAFLSASMSEAGRADPGVITGETRSQAAADVRGFLDRFTAETGWRPKRSHPIAGALLYRRYGALVRFVIMALAEHERGDGQAPQEHIYTEWDGLDHFVGDLARELAPGPVAEEAQRLM